MAEGERESESDRELGENRMFRASLRVTRRLPDDVPIDLAAGGVASGVPIWSIRETSGGDCAGLDLDDADFTQLVHA